MQEARYFETKTCPRCGSELYADMSVCYGCLYDFSRDRPYRQGAGRTAVLPRVAAGPREQRDLPEEVGVLVRTPVIDLWKGFGPEGVSVGRGRDNDVVLHSLAVSRRHLCIFPTPDGMEVSDQGAKNPATYCGREIRGTVVVTYGDSIDVCGCTLVMTGPREAGQSGALDAETSGA